MSKEGGVRFKLEVADIFRQVYADESAWQKLSIDKRRVAGAIITCRTATCGGHINCCNNCGYEEQSYNSCWNRHCPKCQGGAAFEWVSSRSEDLLPVPYYHLVFTLPSELRHLCYQNKKVVYDILFRASSEALHAAAERRGAKMGFFGVLHTWNQKIEYHPHVHYCAAGVGFSVDGKRAVQLGNERFFLPVRVLSKLYRGKFIDYLKRSYHSGKLKFLGELESLADPRAFEHLISRSATNDWVVYAKRPFAGPQRVLKYLASYTHRIAISNSRLRSLENGTVTFVARDQKQKHKKRLIKLYTKEFSRRFMLHLLPRKFRRVRYFGYLYNEKRKNNLALLRNHLKAHAPLVSDSPHPQTCPSCSQGRMSFHRRVKPHRNSTRTPKKRLLQFSLEPPLLQFGLT